jgi:hypothetical protein
MDTRIFKVVTNDIPDDALEALKSQQEQSDDIKGNKEAESDQLDPMTVARLKTFNHEHGLKVSEHKADLKERLREHLLKSPAAETSIDEFDEMSDEESRQSFVERGWEDPSHDARRADKMLKQHGFEFDVLLYISWVARAIQTGVYVLNEFDSIIWLPTIKSWRLNERMYGAESGEDQLKRWRRGFKVRPPTVSSYSKNYPGNDFRRINYVKDLGVSWTETLLNRSIEQRRLQIHQESPQTALDSGEEEQDTGEALHAGEEPTEASGYSLAIPSHDRTNRNDDNVPNDWAVISVSIIYDGNTSPTTVVPSILQAAACVEKDREFFGKILERDFNLRMSTNLYMISVLIWKALKKNLVSKIKMIGMTM